MEPLTTNVPAFRDKYGFLSNFYPCKLVYEEIEFSTSEHAFMSGKTLDKEEKQYIASLLTPAAAKKYGRAIKLRSDWEEVKFQIMEDVLRIKFSIPKMKEKLLETKGFELVETNWWHDNCYGDCRCKKCESIVGQNNLGKILMKIRESI